MAKTYSSWSDVGVVPRSGTKAYKCPKCVERNPTKNRQNKDLYIPDANGDFFKCFSPSCEYHDSCWIGEPKTFTKPKPYQYTENIWDDFWANERASRGFSVEFMKSRDIAPVSHNFGGGNIQVAMAYPFYDVDGTLLSYAYRPKEKSIGFRMAVGAEPCFYNLRCMAKYMNNEDPIPYLVITEGMDDCESFVAAGVDLVWSLPNGASIGGGKQNFIHRNMDLISRCEVVYIATDDDFEGNKAAEELARRIGKRKCKRVKLPALTRKPKDANDVLRLAVEKGVRQKGLDMLAGFRSTIEQACETKTAYSVAYPVEGVADNASVNAELMEMYNIGTPVGCKLNLPCDEYITWQKGRLCVISGKYGSAKTDFVVNASLRLAEYHKWKFAVYMPETGRVAQVKKNYIQVMCGTMIDKMQAELFQCQQPSLDVMQYCMEWLDKRITFIDSSSFKGGLTVENYLLLAEELVKEIGIDAIIGDPFNAFKGAYAANNGMSGADVLNDQLTRVQEFKQETNCSVWFVPHPTGAAYKNSKDITELFELNFGAIWGNKVDVGVLLARQEGTRQQYGDNVSVNTRKCKERTEGKQGEAILAYDHKSGRFGTLPSGTSGFKFDTLLPYELINKSFNPLKEEQTKANNYFDNATSPITNNLNANTLSLSGEDIDNEIPF